MVSISIHHCSPFNFDKAKAKTPVVHASRSFLKRPSLRARTMPKVSLIVAYTPDRNIGAHPQFLIIGRCDHLDVAKTATRISVNKNLFFSTAVGAAKFHMLLSKCLTPAPRHKGARLNKWSGWQELNLRGHAPKTCGWPLPYTRTLVARHGIEPYPLAFQTSTLPSSSRAKLWWTVRDLNSHFTVAGRG